LLAILECIGLHLAVADPISDNPVDETRPIAKIVAFASRENEKRRQLQEKELARLHKPEPMTRKRLGGYQEATRKGNQNGCRISADERSLVRSMSLTPTGQLWKARCAGPKPRKIAELKKLVQADLKMSFLECQPHMVILRSSVGYFGL
jgi:hypothetical protein